MKVDIYDAYELAGIILELEDCDDCDYFQSIESALHEKLGITIEQFAAVVGVLIPFTVPAQIISIDGCGQTWAHGFVYKGAFIVKEIKSK